MNLFVRVVGVLAVMVLLGGCVGNRLPNIPPRDGDDSARVSVKINWNEFDTVRPMAANRVLSAASEIEANITHVGARLEYPQQNGVFMQSVSKGTAETEGIITMQVPPSPVANLYVVAAEYGGQGYGSDLAHWFGVVRNISIAPNSALTIEMDDIEWVEATWYVDWMHAQQYESGTILSSKASATETIYIHISDPFRIGHIGIYGASKPVQSPPKGGWYSVGVVCKNPTQGTANVSRCLPNVEPDFQPYVRVELFNLPKVALRPGRLAIPPLVEPLYVRWQ